MKPKKSLPVFIPHPDFDNPAKYRALLKAPLPPLPPALTLVDGVAMPSKEQLSREETERAFILFNAARKRGDSARAAHLEEYLVRHNLPLVGALYQRLPRPLSIDADVAFSVGAEGLLRAVRTFDVARGLRFSTLACHIIVNCFYSESMKAAKRPGGMVWCNLATLPAVAPLGQPGDFDEGWIDPPAPAEPEPWHEERAKLYDALRTNTAGLTTQELMTITRYLGASKIGYQELGKKLGVSRERARQLTLSAIDKLRAALCED